jgi:hypothetical protein
VNPNSHNLYAGISNAQIAAEKFDLGHGVTLSKTYAHFMAPFLMAFAPAEPGKPHPAPWKAASGGLAFDISAELFIPRQFALPHWFDRINTVWWLTALMRLKGAPLVFVPVIASESFATISSLKHEPYFWPIEIYTRHLIPVLNPGNEISEDALEWIKENWISGGKLMNESDDFNLAFQAFDQCIWTGQPALSLVALWGALERLFSPSPYELRFRVSAAIASFLEHPGKERHSLHRKIVKLYDARSKAAHGSGIDEAKPLFETYALMKRVLIKLIENGHVPSRGEIEACIFGDATSA